jgi:hypothetical protein
MESNVFEDHCGDKKEELSTLKAPVGLLETVIY